MIKRLDLYKKVGVTMIKNVEIAIIGTQYLITDDCLLSDFYSCFYYFLSRMMIWILTSLASFSFPFFCLRLCYFLCLVEAVMTFCSHDCWSKIGFFSMKGYVTMTFSYRHLFPWNYSFHVGCSFHLCSQLLTWGFVKETSQYCYRHRAFVSQEVTRFCENPFLYAYLF